MKNKILIISDSCYLSTGFSTVARNIYKLLKDIYEVRFFSTISHRQKKRLPLNYINSGKTKEMFYKAILDYKPDLVISISDIWRLSFLYEIKSEIPFRWLAYVPVEGRYFPETVMYEHKKHDLKKYLEYADNIVAYSKFGLNELNKIVKTNAYIYHGVDKDVFYKKPIDKSLKKKYFPMHNNSFMFLAVGDNMMRKRYDLLLKAWKKFKTKNTNAFLMLLTHPVSPANGWDIPLLLNRLNINGSVYYDKNYSKAMGISLEELVNFYNMADAFIMLSAAEGFGLPYLEAMACGTPVIYTGYGTPLEYINDAGIAVKVRDTVFSPITNTEWTEPCVKSASNAMRKIYEKSHIKEQLVIKAEQLSEKLQWKNLKDRWIEEINFTIKKKLKMGLLL